MSKLLIIANLNSSTEIVVEATMKKLPIICQSILGYRCMLTTTKCAVKGAAVRWISRRFLFVVGAACSGAAGILFLVSAAFSVIVPNISIPLMAIEEVCLYVGIMIDGKKTNK
jgi:Na+-translocating ferredoxin:NAD+ oxidoreductase RnfA subunit